MGLGKTCPSFPQPSLNLSDVGVLVEIPYLVLEVVHVSFSGPRYHVKKLTSEIELNHRSEISLGQELMVLISANLAPVRVSCLFE